MFESLRFRQPKDDMPRQLLFSVTAKDLDVQTFCTGGNGGQHRNAKQNGVRIIHRASGARVEHRDGRDQGANKKAAFEKLVETQKWKAWHRLEVAKRIGIVDEAEHATDLAMQAKNILVEVKDEEGRWTPEGILTVGTGPENQQGQLP